MHELVGFFLSVVLSFWGSLQLGLVNVKVIETTLAGGFKKAQPVALGGSLPELIYASIAIFFVDQIRKYEGVIEAFSWILIPVFAALGIYYLIKKKASPDINPSKSGFWKGFALGMINPQLVLYWTLVFFYLSKEWELNSFIAKIGLVLGAMLGAWLALLMFAYLTHRFRQKLLGSWSVYLYKSIGVFFIALSLWELWNKL